MVAEVIKSTMPMPMAEVIKSTTVVAESTIKSTMVTTVDTTMGVAAVAIVTLDGNLDRLHNLERNLLGDVHGNLDGLDVLEGFGDGNVLHDGDLDGDLDGVGLGDQLDLGGDGGVGDLSVGLGVH